MPGYRGDSDHKAAGLGHAGEFVESAPRLSDVLHNLPRENDVVFVVRDWERVFAGRNVGKALVRLDVDRVPNEGAIYDTLVGRGEATGPTSKTFEPSLNSWTAWCSKMRRLFSCILFCHSVGSEVRSEQPYSRVV